MSGQGIGSFTSQDLGFSKLLLWMEVDAATQEPGTQD